MSSDDNSGGDVWADLERGEVALSLNEARRLPCLRRDGRAPDLSTVYRFTIGGGKAVGGERVILEHFSQGGGRRTTRSAVFRFLRRLNGTPATSKPSAAALAKAHQRAEATLTAARI